MNLYLIGYRGSGKSSVAPILADLLCTRSVDTDEIIETISRHTIAQIFTAYGEAGFRRLESDALKRFPQEEETLVISLGGGAPIQPENRNWMQQHGKTVWLMASPEVLWERIRGDDSSPSRRPALTDQDGLEEVREMIARRNPVYSECADYTIDVTSLSPEQIAADIACWWNSVDKQ